MCMRGHNMHASHHVLLVFTRTKQLTRPRVAWLLRGHATLPQFCNAGCVNAVADLAQAWTNAGPCDYADYGMKKALHTRLKIEQLRVRAVFRSGVYSRDDRCACAVAKNVVACSDGSRHAATPLS